MTRFQVWTHSIHPKSWKQGLGILCVILAINIFALTWLSHQYRQFKLSFQVSPVLASEVSYRGPEPTQVRIADVGIDTTVNQASISAGIWETSSTTASHLSSSARPEEGSNIVIYGHNYASLFGPLHQVEVGDIIELETDRGKVFAYQVSNITTVDPDQIEVVLPTNQEQLTLYTCTGLFDSKRLIVTAQPIGVRSL